MGQSHATSRDTVRLLEIIAGAHAVDEEVFYSNVLRGISELVPCDDITFQLMDVQQRTAVGVTVLADGRVVGLEGDPGEQDPEAMDRFWQAFFAPGGCSYNSIRAGRPDFSMVLRRSDRMGAREYSRTLMGRVDQERGVKHELLATMEPFGCLDRRLLLFRSDGVDFSDREVQIITLVRPHLGELHLRRARELRGVPDLTLRQWEILRRVSLGSSNQQVARALGLSVATVRKHLENIFFRLGVASRTEAVRKVSGWL